MCLLTRVALESDELSNAGCQWQFPIAAQFAPTAISGIRLLVKNVGVLFAVIGHFHFY